MSRRDILTVATLAAHLARHCALVCLEDDRANAERGISSKAASDAMTLQRLGRSVRNSYKKAGEVSYDHEGRCIAFRAKADDVLKPYGLTCRTRLGALIIFGLPGNTLGGDGEGFGI